MPNIFSIFTYYCQLIQLLLGIWCKLVEHTYLEYSLHVCKIFFQLVICYKQIVYTIGCWMANLVAIRPDLKHIKNITHHISLWYKWQYITRQFKRQILPTPWFYWLLSGDIDLESAWLTHVPCPINDLSMKLLTFKSEPNLEVARLNHVFWAPSHRP